MIRGGVTASRWVKYIGLVAAVGVVAFLMSVWTKGDSESASALAYLRGEQKLIQPLPQSISQDCESWRKSDRAFVQCVYTVDATYERIRSFYDAELAEQSWSFTGEEPVQFAGRDYGGRIARYRKGEYQATLEYAGKKEGWDYALSLTWTLDQP